MLHTAGDQRPVQHEWLFGAAAFGLERAVGLQGLRLVHVIAVLGIVLLVFASFRRESGAALPAVLATCIFLLLSWRRLYQLRPDLVSIAAAIAIYQLILVSWDGPSRRQVALATGLIWVWANVHSLFAIGLACVALMARAIVKLIRNPEARATLRAAARARVTELMDEDGAARRLLAFYGRLREANT